MTIYAGEWKDRADIVCETEYGANIPTEDELVYARYDSYNYEGDAIIVFVRDGVWYENNDGHCSCNGLDQWAPEVTSPEALLLRTKQVDLCAAVRARMESK